MVARSAPNQRSLAAGKAWRADASAWAAVARRRAAARIDHREQEIGDPVIGPAPGKQALRTQGQDLDEEGPQQCGVLRQTGQVGLQHPLRLGSPVHRRVQRIFQNPQTVPAGVLVQGNQRFTFAVKVFIERASRYARLAHDVRYGGFGIPLAGHAVGEPLQQALSMLRTA